MNLFLKTAEEEMQAIILLRGRVETQLKQLKPGQLVTRKRVKGKVYYERNVRTSALTPSRILEIKKYHFFRHMEARLAHDQKLLATVLAKYEDYDSQAINAGLKDIYRLKREDYIQTEFHQEAVRRKQVGIAKAKEWMKDGYPTNQYPITGYPNTTNDGKRVRSLAEATIYNLLLKYGVPFRYECELRLRDEHNRTVRRHPDFTILLADGSHLYWEHVGMLSDEEYRNQFLEKLRLYNLNGIVAGDNLILTSGGEKGALNTAALERLIQNMILPYVNRMDADEQ